MTEAELTEAERRALAEQALDELVEYGIFRMVGIDAQGRKVYVATEAGRVIVNPSKTKQ